MLKKLREKKTAKKVWIILAIVVVPPFVLWGLGGAVRSQQRHSIYKGNLFGRTISALEYTNALGAVKNQALIIYGDSPAEAPKDWQLESEALQRIFLLDEAKKRKISAGDKEVIYAIEKSPVFQRNGKFDSEIYSSTLQYYFHTQPRVFEEETRENLVLAKLYEQVTKGLGVSDKETREAYEKENEQLSIYYIASIISEFMKELAVSDEELKDYFSKNSIRFKQPVSFNVQYATLPFENEAAAEEKARNFLLRLSKREDFAQVAKDFGTTVKETGLFVQTDPIPGIGWAPQVLTYIFKAKAGEYLPPVRADKNYYILRLKERKDPYIPDLESIKDKVKQVVTKQKAESLAKAKIDACLNKLKEAYQKDPRAVDFDKIAKLCGLKSDSTKEFNFASYIEGIGASDLFWTTARILKEGDFSEVITTPSGYFIIKLKSRTPIDEKKFESDKEKFSKTLLEQKKQEKFTLYIQELARKLQLK